MSSIIHTQPDFQGDGVSYESIDSILSTMKENGWSADNLVFGSGGALLQRIDRWEDEKEAINIIWIIIPIAIYENRHYCYIWNAQGLPKNDDDDDCDDNFYV